MTFKSVFIAIFMGTALVVAALLVNRMRPAIEVAQPTPDLIRATGKCAECHRQETSALVHEYERSRHARASVNCLDCHQPVEGQDGVEHKGFRIAAGPLTGKNCAGCHTTQYEQYVRSRHAAPAWAAVAGRADFSSDQMKLAMQFHPEAVDRPPNALARLEGSAATALGCKSCHGIGKPNPDGSFGSCTACHARHAASVALARQPETCGQCHMGPDHAQLEIYRESKHGVLFGAQKDSFDLSVPPRELTTRAMPVPTCATCHMSGLEGMKVTHDTTERLSWYLFAPISARRPGHARSQTEMKEVCLKCHSRGPIDDFFEGAERVVRATNEKIAAMQDLMTALRHEGLLTPAPFDEPIEFLAFDFWHYYGRTAKHGAFMGGADFVQWHGAYELLLHRVELESMARELRARRSSGQAREGDE
ncbi:MAG: ammonia-forming cytochrome c nitrite reductase subunit c552 [Myxococcota bacterium]